MPTSDNDELTKVKMYAVVDGEYVEVMELQGEITLSEADEKAGRVTTAHTVSEKRQNRNNDSVPIGSGRRSGSGLLRLMTVSRRANARKR